MPGLMAGEPVRLDCTSAPLHTQLADALRTGLHGLPVGSSLPSEAALCRQYGVARSVVRQALATLAAEGRIVREAGRTARVALVREHHRLVQRSTGLHDQLKADGVTLESQVLDCRLAEAPAEVQAFFGTPDTVRLDRLRVVGGEPLAYVTTWLSNASVPGLNAAMLNGGSLHRLLATRYGLRPGNGRHHIRAVAAQGVLAQVLAVPEGSPLLMLEGHGLDQYGRPLEWFSTWHRADRLVFDVDVDDGDEVVSPQLAGSDQQTSAPMWSNGDNALASRLANAERLLAELGAEIKALGQSINVAGE